MNRQWSASIIGLYILMGMAGYWFLIHPTAQSRVWIWALCLALTVLVVMVISKDTTNYWSGFLIDNRNMMSLSRLQMIIWMLVVFPALFVGALSNIAGLGGDFLGSGPLEINIPTQLLAVLGLSGATMAAAPAILSTKATATPHSQELPDTTKQLNLKPDQSGRDGKVFLKTYRVDASWKDLFRGDEVGNADTLDLSKLQQFFITVLLAVVYLAAIRDMFADDGAIQSLPSLSEKFVWLLAASQGTYLAYKAAPHTKDADKASSDGNTNT